MPINVINHKIYIVQVMLRDYIREYKEIVNVCVRRLRKTAVF